MTSAAKKIFGEAMNLPAAERRLVAEALLESTTDASDHDIDPAWHEELERRIEQIASGEVQPESLSEVRRKIRAALAR